MRVNRTLFAAAVAMCGLLVALPAHGARILNPEIESQLDQKQQLIKFDLLFDPGEKAVALEVYALEFKDGATPPLGPIASNNPTNRATNGQYVAKSVVEQKDGQRVQKVSLIVPEPRQGNAPDCLSGARAAGWQAGRAHLFSQGDGECQ